MNPADLDGLEAALKAYDARLAECPVNIVSYEICPVCKATASESCRRDNPWPVVEAARQALARRAVSAPGGGEVVHINPSADRDRRFQIASIIREEVEGCQGSLSYACTAAARRITALGADQ